MDVIIEGPRFYGQEDEEVFFNCLYSLPGFEKVVGQGVKLHLYFNSSATYEAINRLLVICRRWGISIEPLTQYKEKMQPESLFWENDLELP